MSKNDYQIIQFDPQKSTEEILESYFDLLDELLFEIDSESVLPSRDERLKQTENPYPVIDHYFWLVKSKKQDSNIIGYAKLGVLKPTAPHYNEYKHVAGIKIHVLKEFRRKGIGTQLLQTMIEKLGPSNEITKLQAIVTLESGKNFCEKFQGELTKRTVGSKLTINDVDMSTVNQWIELGEKLAKEEGTIIETYDRIPDSLLDDYCYLNTVILTQIPGDNSEENVVITPESYRQQEKQLINLGGKLITKITRESNGKISGITELMFEPISPEQMGQRFTGVKEEYRGKGLAKWLKADMLLFVKNEFPEIKYLTTGNANENEPMLSINDRLGFKISRQIWWFDLNLKSIQQIYRDKH